MWDTPYLAHLFMGPLSVNSTIIVSIILQTLFTMSTSEEDLQPLSNTEWINLKAKYEDDIVSDDSVLCPPLCHDFSLFSYPELSQ